MKSLRREYARDGLVEDQMKDDAIGQFSLWFQQAIKTEEHEANAMSLATVDPGGRPSSRIVLLKGFDEEGFRFFTNYESRKGKELSRNPHAALCFFWPVLERQVRIEGKAEKVSREESEDYFRSRPRLSKLGAWASNQSSEVPSREQLEETMEQLQKKFEGSEIPVPGYWGGFLLRPERIEFWQGRPGRLHDRILYSRNESGWDISRLAP